MECKGRQGIHRIDRVYVNPDRVYVNPDRIHVNPDRIYVNPDRVYSYPDRIYRVIFFNWSYPKTLKSMEKS